MSSDLLIPATPALLEGWSGPATEGLTDGVVLEVYGDGSCAYWDGGEVCDALALLAVAKEVLCG